MKIITNCCLTGNNSIKMMSRKCLDQWSTHDVLTYCDEYTLFKLKCINHLFHENSSSLINKSVIMYQKITNQKQFQIIFDVLGNVLDCVNITLSESYKAHSINFCVLQVNDTKDCLINAKFEFDGFIQKSRNISIYARSFVEYMKSHYFDLPSHMGIFCNKQNMLRLTCQYENEKIFGSFPVHTCKRETINHPTSEFHMKITINTHKFHNMCNKMIKAFGTHLEISYVPNKLMFACNGEDTSFEKTYIIGENSDVQVEFTHQELVKNLRQVYHLKNINKFSKFATLCENMEIFLSTRTYPIALKYTTNCGEITTFVTPSETNVVRRYDSEDSDDQDD